ncbi:hypothetical protein EYF80_038269 [Liparis tanakae]|uniref:Uncharacterized protein n=1 Tax=Liparis tanakae TaxID=230148 RepID=A0A4Z2GDA0_9TELE|nr:hypothetical protein EYF80_038269 [Liparis tanakae]
MTMSPILSDSRRPPQSHGQTRYTCSNKPRSIALTGRKMILLPAHAASSASQRRLLWPVCQRLQRLRLQGGTEAQRHGGTEARRQQSTDCLRAKYFPLLPVTTDI